MTLPTAPSRTMSAETFDTTTDAFIGALPQFEADMNALAVAMNLNSTTDTSVSSVLIGTGAKSFTVSSGKSFWPGMWLVIADTAAPTTNAMFCQVTSYSGTALVVNSYAVQGSGTIASWQISQSAPAALGGLYAALAGATFTGLVNLKTGANIASAATINLSTATGNLVHITGTTPTSAVTMTAGQWMRCIADGAWPLTYHATTNRISGGADYMCTAGDTVDYFYDGTTVIGNITKKDGTPVVLPAGALIAFTAITATDAAWAPNALTTKMIVMCVGGGGGGGGCGATNKSSPGGHAGARAFKVSTSVSGTYAATIGAGGTGSAGASGTQGGTTSFIGTGLSLSCAGGLGGAIINLTSSAGVGFNGESAVGVGGIGGTNANGAAAGANSAAGGGGGGDTGGSSRAGGSGGSGVIYVWEYA